MARAKSLLRGWGFPVVRVRPHGRLARIEVPAGQISRLCGEPFRFQVISALNGPSYAYICVDLLGFRSGSLNEEL